MKNKIALKLIELGLSTQDSFRLYQGRVRDRDDMKVFRCERSGVFVLDTPETDSNHLYESRLGFEYWSQIWDKEAIGTDLENSRISPDDRRRACMLKPLVTNKKLFDFGCGQGGLLRLLKNEALEVSGLELQPGPREYLRKEGMSCFDDLRDVPDDTFDFVTLFHVFEHLEDPTTAMKVIKTKMKQKGQLIVEVPHARDALLSLYNSEAFKSFTFMSEHLILHTRDSLRLFIEDSGFKVNSVQGIQRYPMVNHLHWLSQGTPGGQNYWGFLNSESLQREYESVLVKADLTDTIIAFCSI